MSNKIIINVIQSIIEKIILIGTQFVLSFFLIRMLDRNDYGIIGVVTGYFVFVNFVNIGLESIMLRDHKKYEKDTSKYFLNFLIFNFIKILIFLVVAASLSLWLVFYYDDIGFLYAISSITIILIADTFVSPFLIYTTTKLKQNVVTKIATFRSILNIVLILGLILSPSLEYNALKDLIVSLLYMSIWVIYSKKFIDYKEVFSKVNFDLKFIKTSLFQYSIWTHFNGAVTNFIYKSDTFFLSFFVSLNVVGNYNVALTSANVANLISMVFGYQNSVALTHAKSEKDSFEISNSFIRASVYLGLITLFIYIAFGKWYLRLITGQRDVDDMFSYMILIVVGIIIVKTFASPLTAYINIKGSVKQLFRTVLVPTFVLSLIIYFVSSKFFGPLGVAVSNVIIASFWIIALSKEVKKYEYDFTSIFNFKGDYLFIKQFLQRLK